MKTADEKLDQIMDNQSEMKSTLVVQQQILDYHVKRTDLLEAQVEPMKARIDSF